MTKKLIVMAAIVLMAFAAIATQCAGITRRGTQCKRMASPGSSYCWQHGGTTKAQRAAGMTDADAAKARCKATTNAGTQCKRTASPGSEFCWQHGGVNAGSRGSDDPPVQHATGNALDASTSERVQCDGVTKSGRRCTRKARPGSAKCWQHAK